ncbi:hypothetical protein PSHT_15499, partial [Puccinia striiformis]
YGHARQKLLNKANALSQSRRQNQPSTYFEQALNQPFGLLTVSSKAPKNDLQSATPDCARTFACWLQLGVPIDENPDPFHHAPEFFLELFKMAQAPCF